MRTSTAAALLLVVRVLASSQAFGANPTDAGGTAPSPAVVNAHDLASQRDLEGEAALGKRDFEAARLAFVQAYALDAQTKYLLDLATAEEEGGHPLDSLLHLHEVLRLPNVTDAERRRATPLVAKANLEVGHVRVETGATATIRVDGADMGRTPLADPVDVAPGLHVIEAKIGTRTARTTVSAERGETIVWQLAFEPLEPNSGSRAAPAPAGKKTMPPSFATASGKPPAPLRWVVSAGLVVAGLATFGVVGGLLSAASDQDNVWAGLDAETGVCIRPNVSAQCAALKSAADARAADQNIAIGFTAAGIGLVAAGVVTFIVWPSGREVPEARLVPMITPSGSGLSWTGAF